MVQEVKLTAVNVNGRRRRRSPQQIPEGLRRRRAEGRLRPRALPVGAAPPVHRDGYLDSDVAELRHAGLAGPPPERARARRAARGGRLAPQPHGGDEGPPRGVRLAGVRRAPNMVLGPLPARSSPGKPVKYLVLTHHHMDHAGGGPGLRGPGRDDRDRQGHRRALQEGAGRALHAQPRPALARPLGDAGDRGGRPARAVGTGSREVRAYVIDANPHSEGLMFGFVPHSGASASPPTSGAPGRGPAARQAEPRRWRRWWPQ